MLDDFKPDTIHIAVEGPLGRNAKRYCTKRGLAFTTAYHTKFPEYLQEHARVPLWITYRMLRQFHKGSSALMVATASLEQELQARGFQNLVFWTRGVDTELFKPGDKSFLQYPRPIWLCVGRVAPEKNLEALLRLELPGTILIVGGGPQLRQLKREFPNVVFVGPKTGAELTQYYGASDVFVFPSLKDTYGLVLLEALACGLPVAAYPVTGPMDVLTSANVGILDNDLRVAAEKALLLSPQACREFALQHTWEISAQEFLDNLVPCGERKVPVRRRRRRIRIRRAA
jgi:glycosyltransferase involved in cell wall biosynthesis